MRDKMCMYMLSVTRACLSSATHRYETPRHLARKVVFSDIRVVRCSHVHAWFICVGLGVE